MSTNRSWRGQIARWRHRRARQRKARQRRNSIVLEMLEPRRLLAAMNLDLLKADAFELSQAPFSRETITRIPILDFPDDGELESVGMVFQEKDAIITQNYLDQDTFYVKPQVRASKNDQSMRVFTDADRDGVFQERTFQEAAPDFSAAIIQPPVDVNDIPEAGRVLSQLTVGQEQTPGNFPQFLTIGAEGFARFNGHAPQTVGSSYRVAAHNIFGIGGDGEDFPFIREIYATINDSTTTQLLALVDSEAFTGAVSISIDPGPTTVLDVDSTWYPRRELLVAEEPETAFLAYSSLFWKDERHTPRDDTDEAHDLDRLVIGFDTNNDTTPETVVTSTIEVPPQSDGVSVTNFDDLYDGRPVFVSLDNRDQDPAHYSAYASAEYAKRDSYAFEILHSDVDVGLHLYEQPTDSEFHDNIVVAATIRQDLHPVKSVDDGISVVSRHHAFVPTDSDGDGITDLLAGLLGGQQVEQIEHVRPAETLQVPSQYTTIQAAIDAAQPGDRIEVDAGTYTENIFVNKQDLRIVGAGAGQTVIEGVTGSFYPVVQFQDLDRSVVFNGFTVRGGHSTIDRMGGGIDILNASPVIENSEITMNSSRAVGGGISIRGSTSDPLVRHNHIHDNQTRRGAGNFAGLGGGIYVGDEARGVIRNNHIHDNSGWLTSGAIHSGPLTAGAFTLMTAGGSTVIEGNLIEDNSADNNGGICIIAPVTGAQISIRNNILRGNTGNGAAICAIASDVMISNNTIAANSDRAIEITGSEPADVRNNIVVDNAVGIEATATAVLQYNDVWGNTQADYAGDAVAGAGSISSDPLFADANNGDYHLLPGSPAIDAGDPASSFDDADGSRNDMGAYGGPEPFSGAQFLIQPEIDVQGNGQSIADGDSQPDAADHTNLGGAQSGGGSITQTFTIVNTGSSPLSLSGVPHVTLTGPDAGDFQITQQPTTTVAPLGGTTTFTVSFAPSALGNRTATVNIGNSDADEDPYEFAIQGTGLTPRVASVKVLSSTTWVPEFLDQVDPSAGVGFEILAGSDELSTPLPWAFIDRIVIEFTKDVRGSGPDGELTVADFGFVSDLGGISIASVAYDSENLRATLNLTDALDLDRFTVTARDSISDPDGVLLDGDSDNDPGEDFVLAFAVSPGNASFLDDADPLGQVDFLDLGGMAGVLGSCPGDLDYLHQADLNGNGVVDFLDLGFLAGRLGQQLPPSSSAYLASLDALLADEDETDGLLGLDNNLLF